MALIFPFSQGRLEALRAHYTLADRGGRALFTCRQCHQQFIVTPANVTPGNYEGLMAHANECLFDGVQPGRVPARVQPFGTVHER